jgi:hypothetical protein
MSGKADRHRIGDYVVRSLPFRKDATLWFELSQHAVACGLMLR